MIEFLVGLIVVVAACLAIFAIHEFFSQIVCILVLLLLFFYGATWCHLLGAWLLGGAT